MPYPQNLETALKLEGIVRENDCCPATIFLDGGKIRIGIREEELNELAQSEQVKKVTTRDISEILVRKQSGATTVAATMYCAYLAGIKVFATGGIGGVHRYAEETFDISADLTELARTPLIVVSAGAKAILDLGKTLEYLETCGVPVYGWQTESFPGFYSAATPWKVNRIDELSELAEIYRIQRELKLTNGILLTNPVAGEDEIPWQQMEVFINQALSELKKKKISGKKVTPYLLQKITELTEGRSLKANIKLVENNVKLACRLAKEI
jgi:pseudouridine-5'-phosphate glycosidase